MAIKVPQALKPVVDFTIQVTVGAIGFVAILVVAVGVAAAVRLIGSIWFAPDWLEHRAESIEQALFWFDIGCFALFLAAEAIKLVKGLWKEIVST
jgi:hypothetical protein